MINIAPYSFDTKRFTKERDLQGVITRRLSDLRAVFSDRDALDSILQREDPVVYEYWELENNSSIRDTNFGLTRIYPGLVGSEYYMTKGHFHKDSSTELYLTLCGQGKLLLMTRDKEIECQDMVPGVVNYIPAGWAHRTVNVGTEPLDFIWFYPCLVIHDYESILETGYASIVKTGLGDEVRRTPPASGGR